MNTYSYSDMDDECLKEQLDQIMKATDRHKQSNLRNRLPHCTFRVYQELWQAISFETYVKFSVELAVQGYHPDMLVQINFDKVPGWLADAREVCCQANDLVKKRLECKERIYEIACRLQELHSRLAFMAYVDQRKGYDDYAEESWHLAFSLFLMNHHIWELLNCIEKKEALLKKIEELNNESTQPL